MDGPKKMSVQISKNLISADSVGVKFVSPYRANECTEVRRAPLIHFQKIFLQKGFI